ncbi:putative harbinger transposase-derived protein [Helianthus annuus]|nr:putative harbinger transposase-derived protein [Helianthus annuus]
MFFNNLQFFSPDEMESRRNCPFQLNGHLYKRGYYLTDVIHPTWSTFVKVFRYPTHPKEKKLNKAQEAARKDVDRPFGILKGKWGILNQSLRAMTVDKNRSVVYECKILHNINMKDDGNAISPVHIRETPPPLPPPPPGQAKF